MIGWMLPSCALEAGNVSSSCCVSLLSAGLSLRSQPYILRGIIGSGDRRICPLFTQIFEFVLIALTLALRSEVICIIYMHVILFLQ